MRILHVDEQRGWRGGEQQASWLIAGSVARGHEVFVAGRESGPFASADHGGVSVERIHLPFRNEGDFFTVHKLASAIRDFEVDIVHAHTSHAHTMACAAAWWAGRAKTVVSRRIDFRPRGNAFNRWKYRWPDLYIAVSACVATVLHDFGIPKEKVAMVHSSVDAERLACDGIEWGSVGVERRGPIVLSAGALVGHKDHENLLNAFAGIASEFPNAQIVIAGEGELRPAIEAQIEQLDLRGRVHLLGHRTDVPALMRGADLYVSSSWSEGLGTSVLEALACGTPVVAAEAGGAREMVLPGETGRLVPVRDSEALGAAMGECLRAPDESAAMAGAGMALIQEEFTTAKMVERTLACYAKLLD